MLSHRTPPLPRLVPLAAAALLALAFFACDRTERVPSGGESPRASVRPTWSPEHDLTAFVERGIAFESSDGVAVARGVAHEVRVDARGFDAKFSGGRTLRLESALPEDGTPSVRGASASTRRGDVEELVRNGRRHVAQSWRLDERPQPARDFVVRVHPTGLPFRKVDASGLVFGPEGHGLRYGHGTWVDARGRRAPVPARWNADAYAIELRVTRELMSDSVFPATLDPVIGLEQELKEQSAEEEAFVWASAAAQGANDYLVAQVGENKVYTTRVGPDGDLLRFRRRLFANDLSSHMFAGALFDGSDYVVWSWVPGAMRFARFAEDGTSKQETSVQPWFPFTAPLLDGDDIVMLTRESYESGTVECIRLDSSLNVTRTPLVPGEDVARLALGVGGGVVLVAWAIETAESRTLRFQRFAAGSLTPLDDAPRIAVGEEATAFWPSWQIPFDGSRFLLWGWNSESPRTAGVRIEGATGDVLDAAPIPLSDGLGISSVAATPGQFLVVFGPELPPANLHGTRIDGSTGAKLDGEPFPLGLSVTNQLLEVSAGTDYLVPAGPLFVRVRPSDGSVVDSPPINVAVRPHDQYQVRIAYSPTTGLASWEEPTGNVGVRLDRSGAPIGELLEGDVVTEQIAFDGEEFVVASDKLTRRALDGSIVQEHGLPWTNPAVACQPDGICLLAASLSPNHIEFLRIRRGELLDAAPIRLSNAGSVATVVAEDGAFDIWTPSPTIYRVHAADGSVESFLPTGGGTNVDRAWPSLADGRRHVRRCVSWNGPCALVEYDSTLSFSAQVSVDGHWLASDGPSVLTLDVDSSDPRSAFFSRVRRAGLEILEGATDGGRPVAFQAYGLSFANPVALGPGRFVLGYSRWDSSWTMGRVYTRLLTYTEDGESCTDDGECASTYCDAGLCWSAEPPDSGVDGAVPADADADASEDASTDTDASDPEDASNGDALVPEPSDATADVSTDATPTDAPSAPVPAPPDDVRATEPIAADPEAPPLTAGGGCDCATAPDRADGSSAYLLALALATATLRRTIRRSSSVRRDAPPSVSRDTPRAT